MYCCYFNGIFVLLTHVQSPVLISSNDPVHHKLIGIIYLYCRSLQFLTYKIAIILIIEYACLSYASQSKPTRDEALDQAYSRYCASDIYTELMMQFSGPPDKYSILQFTEFLLMHRL
jgi:hypothetical protein